MSQEYDATLKTLAETSPEDWPPMLGLPRAPVTVGDSDFAQVLIRGVLGMRESVTYQAILDEGRTEGRVEEARRILLLQGEDRFGAPRAAVRSAVEAVTDVEQLERLARAVLTANSWEDLLGLPPQRPPAE
jgi:hypothetical protein